MNLFFSNLLIFFIVVGCASKPVPPNPEPPIPAPQSFKMCLIGDTGTGKDEQFLVGKALAKEKCDKVLVAGDIIYNTGLKSKDDDDYKEKFYDAYKELIEDQKVEFLLVAGNHDWYLPGHPKAWIEVAKDKDWLVYPHYYYGLQWSNGVCVFAFDSQYHRDGQVKWFKEVKKEYQSCSFSIAFAHKPYISAGSHGSASGKTKDLIEYAILGQFDLFVAGHDHHLEDMGVIKGTHNLLSGAGAKLRSVDHDEVKVWAKSMLGYVVLDVKKNKGHFKFVGVEKDGNRIVLHEGDIEGKGLR